MNTKEEYPHWLGLLGERYNHRFDILSQRLYDQIIKFSDKSPSNDFINDFIKELMIPGRVHPLTALCLSFMRAYNVESMAYNFPDEAKELMTSIRELLHVMEDASFMDRTRDVFDELKKLPFYYS